VTDTDGSDELDTGGDVGTEKLLVLGTGALDGADGKPVTDGATEDGGAVDRPLGGAVGGAGTPVPVLPFPLTTDEHATTASATNDVAATNRMRTISLRVTVSGRP
jgi:hypothetical protein